MAGKRSYRMQDVAVILVLLAFAGAGLRGLAGADRNQGCVDNAFKLEVALRMYTQDYDEVLPPMDDFNKLSQILSPYISQNPRVVAATMRCPATKNTPYALNVALSNKSIPSIGGDYSAIELFRDAKAHPDGKFTIAYLDGSVLRGGVEQASSAEKNACGGRVRRLNLSVQMYAQDYDETLPIFGNDAEAREKLYPYLRGSRYFQCPETAVGYTFNTEISGLPLAAFADRSAVEVVRDSQIHYDGTITIGYLDGYVQRGGVSYPDNEAECIRRAEALAQATAWYAQENDGKLPPLNDFAAFKSAVYPYTANASRLFYCADTKRKFVLNSALNGMNLFQIADPANTILFKDPIAHRKTGKITVGYADGHADQITP